MTLLINSHRPLFLTVLYCFWIPSFFAHTWNQPSVCYWHSPQEAAPLPGRPFTQSSNMLFFISTWNFSAWYIVRFFPSPDSGAVGVVGAHDLWSQMDLTAVTKAVWPWKTGFLTLCPTFVPSMVSMRPVILASQCSCLIRPENGKYPTRCLALRKCSQNT